MIIANSVRDRVKKRSRNINLNEIQLHRNTLRFVTRSYDPKPVILKSELYIFMIMA